MMWISHTHTHSHTPSLVHCRTHVVGERARARRSVNVLRIDNNVTNTQIHRYTHLYIYRERERDTRRRLYARYYTGTQARQAGRCIYTRIILYCCGVRVVLYDVPEFVLFSGRQRRRQRSEHAGMHPRGWRRPTSSLSVSFRHRGRRKFLDRAKRKTTVRHCCSSSPGGVRFGNIYLPI